MLDSFFHELFYVIPQQSHEVDTVTNSIPQIRYAKTDQLLVIKSLLFSP